MIVEIHDEGNQTRANKLIEEVACEEYSQQVEGEIIATLMRTVI